MSAVQTVSTDWLTYQEATQYLKLSDRGFRLLVSRGLIPSYTLPGTSKVVRFKQSDLDRIMEEGANTKAANGEGD